MVGYHPSAPDSFLLRLRLTDAAPADAIRPHGPTTITDVETMTPAADVDVTTDCHSARFRAR